jgi:hypothetical protein
LGFHRNSPRDFKGDAGIERWVNSQFPQGRGKNERVVSILYSLLASVMPEIKQAA